MYFRWLHYLRLVIAHGSFATAAQAAGVTQPAISYGMKQLQARLERPLFLRMGRRLVPTEFALRVARESEALSGRIDALTATPPLGIDDRVLRIGLTPSAALVCGLALHDHWCGDDPQRSLQLHSDDEGQLLASLAGGALDFAIAPRPRGHPETDLACEPLYRLQSTVCARRGHPLAAAQALADLQQARWAIVGPSVRGPVDVLTEAFSVRGMEPPRVTVSCPDYPSMLHLVAHTDLLAVVPHPVLVSGPLQSQIVRLALRETLPLYDMWLFHADPLSADRARTAQHLLRSLRAVGAEAAAP